MTKLFTAICFDSEGKVYKYRKIKNSIYQLNNFELFAKNEKKCIYINYYDKETKQFIRRKTL